MKILKRPAPLNKRRGGIRRAIAIWGLAGVSAWVLGKQITHKIHAQPEQTRQRVEVSVESANTRPRGQTINLSTQEPLHNVLATRGIHITRTRFSSENQTRIINDWKKFAEKSKNLPAKKMTRQELTTLAREFERRYGIPHSIYRAFIEQESSGNAHAIGGLLELGLTQIRPEKMMEIQELGARISNPLNPRENLLAFTFAFSEYVQSARYRSDSAGNKRERVYEYGGNNLFFQQLPFELQLQIVARIHNRGVNGTFSNSSTNGTYSPDKILEGDRGKYARDILKKYHSFEGSG